VTQMHNFQKIKNSKLTHKKTNPASDAVIPSWNVRFS